MCILIPFVLFIALCVPFVKEGQVCWSLKIGSWKLHVTDEGAWTFLNVIVKSSLSILLLVIASSTTTFPDFLKGLDLLRLPRLLIVIMSFMYRYIFVLLDEARRLMRARSLRYFGSRYMEQFRVLGYMIGVLFIRTFERAERIYCAMLLRGFSGEVRSVKSFRFSYIDFLFIAGIIVLLICIVSGLVYKIEFIKISNVQLWQGL
jgi:cobalt/nickel transport system permease protein